MIEPFAVDGDRISGKVDNLLAAFIVVSRKLYLTMYTCVYMYISVWVSSIWYKVNICVL